MRDVAVYRRQRQKFDQRFVDQMAKSIKQLGRVMIHPIVVRTRRHGAGYILVDGRYRLEAARQLGWENIDAVVLQNISDLEAELIEIDLNLFPASSLIERELLSARRSKLMERRNRGQDEQHR